MLSQTYLGNIEYLGNIWEILYTMLAQADQDNIMWVIFLQKHLCALRSNIARVIFMSDFVSGIF